MKKLLAALLALAAAIVLAGCGHFVPIMPGTDPVPEDGEIQTPADSGEQEDVFEQQPLMSFIGWNDFAQTYYDETPVALSIWTGERGFSSPVFDRASIIAACDALRSMTVIDRAGDAAPLQEQTVFTFTMADGDEYSVGFSGGHLSMYAGSYAVSGGEGLWNIPFPGYSGDFDVFDLYFDENIRAFADNYGADTPVSVGRRSNGGATLTSKDPEVVSRAFSLLAGARIARVENNPDQNIDLTQTTDYVFTLSDGTYYTFSFTGACLAVTANSDYGPVYYWLEGIDELPGMTILPESTIPVFEGGALTDLREDIAIAQQAAFGELDGLTVAGVFVDYTINGQSGYLTLSGDTAAMFVQRVTAITASGETVEPSGEAITVSVTLSDGSGPILYFTGDAIQQMVGLNYPCDSGAMADLRSVILTLSQDENNVSALTGEFTG